MTAAPLKITFALMATTLLAACASYAPPTPVAPSAPPAPVAQTPAADAGHVPIRAAEKWLFGSAESTVLIQQTYKSMVDYVLMAEAKGRGSVIISGTPTQTSMRFTDCGKKPSAVVFDADETLIWNLGYARWAAENDKEFDPKIWDEWERTGEGKVVPLPSAVDAVNKLRQRGLTIIVNTNRDTKNAAETAATLKTAGFGDFVHGETLFLKGDVAPGSGKDPRRAKIAERYCVVAMVGDQLGDFFDPFNDKKLTPDQRRYAATFTMPTSLFGNGWFLLPNATYGPWDRMTYDQTFPAETRWEPKEGQ